MSTVLATAGVHPTETLTRQFCCNGQRGITYQGVVGVLAFDSIDRVRAWYDSPQYDALKAVRDRAGKARIFAVEGVAP
jgi:uncharacterized protein (DUF1330 family)